MQLLLVPPSSLPVPPTLQTHDVPTPHLPPPNEVRVPPAYAKAQKALGKIGLAAPNLLAFDYALWWQIIVRTVEWNLQDEAVTVTFVDGSEERWELGADEEQLLSDELVDDSMSTASSAAANAEANVEAASGTSTQRVAPWAPATVLARLRELCVELRSAYEDLGMAHAHDPLAPEVTTTKDWEMLQRLSAKADMPVPFAWSDAQTMYEYAMEGVDADGELEAEDEESDGTRRAGRPSQTGSPDVGDDEEDRPDPFKHRGQFKPQYRERRTKASLASPSGGEDYLSTIHLLARIRGYLVDLFARTVVPRLRETIPATYSLWAATGAIGWCRREAVRRGGEVGQLLLDLLDDDGDTFDTDSASEKSQPDILVGSEDGAEDPFGFSSGGGLYGHLAEWRAEEKRQQRLADNVLGNMRDDFELRSWCEAALDRARTLEQRDWRCEGNPPRWIRPVRSIEVSSAIDDGDSELDEPRATRSFDHERMRGFERLRLSSISSAPGPPTSPPSELDDDLVALGVPSSLASTPTDSEVTTDEEGDLGRSARRYSPEFFYPDDPLDERFLPPKLPKTLVLPSMTRGREMEEQREKVHDLLNVVNGLQQKLVDLQEFVVDETTRWEDSLEEQRKVKETLPPEPSGLRSPGASSAGPPPPELTLKAVPLKAQPLRKQAGDRALSISLNSALSALSSPAVSAPLKRVKVQKVQLPSVAPRRRQKINLETYVKVVAMSHGIFADPNQPGKRTSRKRSKGPGVELPASDAGPSPRKRPRKSRAVRREGASADLSPPAGSAQQTAGAGGAAAGEHTQDARRLTVFELSNRRRNALVAASSRPASTWAWAEVEDEDEREEDGPASGSADAVHIEQVSAVSIGAAMYQVEPDTDDEAELKLKEVVSSAGTKEVDEGTPPIRSRLDARPESPYEDAYEAPTRPPSPALLVSAPSLTPQRPRLRRFSGAFPTSAERSMVAASQTGESTVAGPTSSAIAPPLPRLASPNPHRPFTLRAHSTLPPLPSMTSSSPPAHPSSPAANASSPPSSPTAAPSLAQRARETFACLAQPPVQPPVQPASQLVPAEPRSSREPPLCLDWPVEAATGAAGEQGA